MSEWSEPDRCFTLKKKIKTRKACRCIDFSAQSAILGCEKLIEVDLNNLKVEGKIPIVLSLVVNFCLFFHLWNVKESVFFFSSIKNSSQDTLFTKHLRTKDGIRAITG